jgi:hypothetical protein
MSRGKGYAPHYRETSSMVTLAGTMAESIAASGTLDKKRAGAHSALDSLLFYSTILRHRAAMLLANNVALRRGAGGAQSGTSLKLTADR